MAAIRSNYTPFLESESFSSNMVAWWRNKGTQAIVTNYILAWWIPWIEEPGRLQSIESQRVRHYWSNLAHIHAQFSILNIHWKDWCWNWYSNTLVTWCEELTHWKRPWCWERLKAGEGGDKGWDVWMASPTQWVWVWANSKEIVKDREAWCAVVHDVTKSWMWLGGWTTILKKHFIKKKTNKHFIPLNIFISFTLLSKNEYLFFLSWYLEV